MPESKGRDTDRPVGAPAIIGAVMLRRRAPLLAVVLALVAAVAAVVLLLRGGDEDSRRPRAPGADPIAFVPAERADVALDLDTRDAFVVLAAQRLIPRISSLTPEQVTPLLGGRVAVATDARGHHLAFSTDAPPPPGGRRARGRVVVVAPRPTPLTPAPGARRRFDARFAGLPPAAASAPRSGRSRCWNLTSRPLAGGARCATAPPSSPTTCGCRSSSTPTRRESSPPICRSPPAPPLRRPTGQAPVVIGLRDPARSVAFARASGFVPELAIVDRLPGFLRPDLDDLGTDGTLTLPRLDPRRMTLRAEPRDPGDWASKLGRLDVLARIADPVVGLDVQERDGVYTLLQDGRAVVRARRVRPRADAEHRSRRRPAQGRRGSRHTTAARGGRRPDTARHGGRARPGPARAAARRQRHRLGARGAVRPQRRAAAGAALSACRPIAPISSSARASGDPGAAV